jgi:cyclopropane-fatty-acyl-phospholipid synthase
MNSECEVSNRTEFLQLLNQNRKFIEGSKTYTRKIMMGLNYFINTKFANSISNSINNISAHYDLGNDMFQLFLDPSMTYSCPIWDLNDPDDDLHKAQLRKLHNVIRKAKIVESDHVLEIGSGWGSFAMEAVKLTGCKVTTLTLSIEQKALADRRIREAGLSDRITVKFCDYRNLSTDFKFDKIVSIEMIEAVGKEYLETYFETCHNLLKEDGGLMVLQAITIHENRYDRYSNQVDFIQKYIFPGGHLPSITMLISSIHSGTKGMLITNNLEDIGAHYAKALRLWCENFTASYPLISKGNPEKYNTVFKRCWQYYFNYCETGFREHLLGTVQIVLTRPKNKAVVQGVPL